MPLPGLRPTLREHNIFVSSLFPLPTFLELHPQPPLIERMLNPPSPIPIGIWLESPELFDFFLIAVSSFSRSITNAPVFPISTVGEDDYHLGTYCLTQSSLLHMRNSTWVLISKITVSEMSLLPTLPGQNNYFQFV